MSSTKRYKVVLIEPSDMIAFGITQMFSQSSRFNLLTRFVGLQECTEAKMKRLLPDVLIVNPQSSGYENCPLVRSRFDYLNDFVILALTYYPFPDDMIENYDGNITLFDSLSKIERKIVSAFEQNGRLAVDKGEQNELSQRQKEILVAVAKGKTNKEIADYYHISIFTVVTHRKNISRKLGIHSISGLTVYALLNKLIEMPEG